MRRAIVITLMLGWLTSRRRTLALLLQQSIVLRQQGMMLEQVAAENLSLVQQLRDAMRTHRDLVVAVLLAADEGVDIRDALRALASDLSDSVAQMEEHLP